MRRRKFLQAGFCAIALAGSDKVQAQPAQARVAEVAAGKAFPFRYFNEAMGRVGWTEGRNLTLSVHILGGDPQQRTRVAAEVLAARPDLVVAAGVSDALAVQAMKRGIPIVVITGTELEQSGLVHSLRHPCGNVTGISTIGMDLNGKRLGLVQQL